MTESPAELKPTDTDPHLSDKNKDKQEQKLEPDPKALPAGQLLPGEAEGAAAPKPPFARIGGQVAKWWNNDESGKAPGDVMPPVVVRLIPNRVDGAVEGDNSVVEIWPNNTVVMHATQGGGRIIPTVMAPVERPNQA